MMNSLPMMNASLTTLQLVVFLGLNLLVGLYFFRRWRAALKRNTRRGLEQNFPMSIFSRTDHPALLKHHEDVNPLTEAEIYVIYGRRNEAQKVLDNGIRDGLISPEEVISFWSERGHTKAA